MKTMLTLISLIFLSACGSEENSLPQTWYVFGDSLSDTREGIYQYGEQLRDSEKEKYSVELKGVGGNTVLKLLKRVDVDILKAPPSVLTILVGINDVKLFCENNFSQGALTVEQYRQYYDALLVRIQEKSPQTKIVLIMPFVFYQEGYKYTNPALAELLPCIHQRIDDYRAVVKDMGSKFNVEVIETQPDFNQALRDHEISELSPDGVHLTTLGNTLLTKMIEPKI